MKLNRTSLGLAGLLLAGSASLPALADDAGRQPGPASYADLVRARQHIFGLENVDARTGQVREDKVILSWFSVASFAAAVRGHVVLLDAYIYRRALRPAYVPTTLQELVDLKPEAIFLGHGHGDHADLAANIAVRTGATIVGAAEHCDAMRGDAARQFGAGTPVNCQAIISAGSAPGAEVVSLRNPVWGMCITAFKHVHSGTVPADPTLPPNPINPVRDPRVDQLFPPQPAPTDGAVTQAGAGGLVSIFYQFTAANSDFTFAWHDTAGPLKEQAPQVLGLLRLLPKTDVELGSAVSLGETVNGVRDIVTYIDALRPKVFYQTHTDNFNIGASEYYLQAILRQFDIIGLPATDRPDIRGLHDPYDYVRPLLITYNPNDRAWRDVRAGRRALQCRG